MNTIELLQLLSVIAFISAGVVFLVAVALFFLLNIPKITGDLSGRTARKAIEKKKKNSLEGISNDTTPANMRGNPAEAVTFSRGIGTEKIASMRLSKQNSALQTPSESQTALSEPSGSQTTVLESSGSQTTLLGSSESQETSTEPSGNQTTLLKPQGGHTTMTGAGQAARPVGAVMQDGIQNTAAAPQQSTRRSASASAQTAAAGNSPEFGQTIELDETTNEQTSNNFGETILLSAAGAGTGLGSQKEIGFSSSSEIIE